MGIALSLSYFLQFIEGKISRSEIPKKAVLITFDDGYSGLVQNALPILKKNQMQACLFVTTSYIQEREQTSNIRYLSLGDLRSWVDSGMEVALHSHDHLNYRETALSEIEMDLRLAEKVLTDWKIPFEKAVAYPYGARPADLTSLKRLFSTLGVRAAFRIGNRLFPWNERERHFEIKRIDIQGSDYRFEFSTKVRKGRSQLF